MISFNIWPLVQWYFRPFIKWFLRKTTKLCELQRICYGEKPGAARTIGVEKSLVLSRTTQIKELIINLDFTVSQMMFTPAYIQSFVDPVIHTVLVVKQINPKVHRPFMSSFRTCIAQIWCYRQLCLEVHNLSNTPYDASNKAHEETLLKLWKLLVPYENLVNRVSKQWQHIGFQGDDPKTDFRGMGILGLENLVFFAEHYSQAATHVLSHSLHPKYGYTFAIVGINLTSLAYNLLKEGIAKTYMFNNEALPSLGLFHRFYCYLFYRFDRLWIECKPRNIMEFPSIFTKFEESIRNDLADPASVFRINLEVDCV